VRIFKTKWFARFARKEHIDDKMLIAAVREIERGLNDGDLGGGLIKKRLARVGAERGKRYCQNFYEKRTSKTRNDRIRQYAKQGREFVLLRAKRAVGRTCQAGVRWISRRQESGTADCTGMYVEDPRRRNNEERREARVLGRTAT
jgi:hypothetical protein